MDSRVCYPDLRCLPDQASGRSPGRILLLRRRPEVLIQLLICCTPHIYRKIVNPYRPGWRAVFDIIQPALTKD
jgi:hypothetical protein